MKYVYLIQSVPYPTQRYTGLAEDYQRRIDDHNAGKSRHTSKYRPWKLVTAIAFVDDAKAVEFERYLKTGSGQAFANRHLW